jgi:hypothetical protein
VDRWGPGPTSPTDSSPTDSNVEANFVKSKTPTFGGSPAPPSTARHPTPLGIPRQGQPERKVTPPPFKAQTPPAHALDANKFESEPPTKQKNMTASIYQSLLSVFDEMTDEQRMEFVDLAAVFGSLTVGARKDLIPILEYYAKLGPEDRQAVLETVTSLETTRRR